MLKRALLSLHAEAKSVEQLLEQAKEKMESRSWVGWDGSQWVADHEAFFECKAAERQWSAVVLVKNIWVAVLAKRQKNRKEWRYHIRDCSREMQVECKSREKFID